MVLDGDLPFVQKKEAFAGEGKPFRGEIRIEIFRAR